MGLSGPLILTIGRKNIWLKWPPRLLVARALVVEPRQSVATKETSRTGEVNNL